MLVFLSSFRFLRSFAQKAIVLFGMVLVESSFAENNGGLLNRGSSARPQGTSQSLSSGGPGGVADAPDFVACGLSCSNQKAYESLLFQLQYTQTKSKVLKDAWADGAGHDDRNVIQEIQGFCTSTDFSSDREICYKNTQLFYAGSIQRYQDAMKEVADRKAQLTTGRAANGAIQASSRASVEMSVSGKSRSMHIPTMSEVREYVLKAYRSTGVLRVSAKDLKANWEEMLYLGKNSTRPEVFEGRSAKVKDAEGGSAGSSGTDKKAQVYVRKGDGRIEKDAKLVSGADRVKDGYEKNVAKKVDQFQETTYDLKSVTDQSIPQSDKSLSYKAFMETRTRLGEAFAGEVKKIEANRDVAGSGAAGSQSKKSSVPSSQGPGKASAPGASGVMVTNDVVKAAPASNFKFTYGEDAQPTVSSERSYDVRHGGLNESLSEEALKEAEK
jgi:hypothetical protein